jgi:signal transduction histidine kinase
VTTVSGTIDRLRERCAAALDAHLEGAGESALLSAYELGREAMSNGLGVLDMTTIILESMAQVVRDRLATGDPQLLERVSPFLLECYSPFEMAHRGVKEANSALRRVNEVREGEIRRLAQELHDQASQLLVAVHLSLDQVAATLTPADQERLGEVRLHLLEAEAQVRRISHEMRPAMLDDLGLIPALSFLCDGVSNRGGFRIQVEGVLNQRLPARVETTLYRAAQEALNNVARHAHAGNVTLSVRQDRTAVTLRIADDGVGFEFPSSPRKDTGSGLGLAGIRERVTPLGGTLAIRSTPGIGTELRISIPLTGRDHASRLVG